MKKEKEEVRENDEVTTTGEIFGIGFAVVCAIVGAVWILMSVVLPIADFIIEGAFIHETHTRSYEERFPDRCEREEENNSITYFPCSKGWMRVNLVGTTSNAQ